MGSGVLEGFWEVCVPEAQEICFGEVEGFGSVLCQNPHLSIFWFTEKKTSKI